jgi:hypothetical protein
MRKVAKTLKVRVKATGQEVEERFDSVQFVEKDKPEDVLVQEALQYFSEKYKDKSPWIMLLTRAEDQEDLVLRVPVRNAVMARLEGPEKAIAKAAKILSDSTGLPIGKATEIVAAQFAQATQLAKSSN